MVSSLEKTEDFASFYHKNRDSIIHRYTNFKKALNDLYR